MLKALELNGLTYCFGSTVCARCTKPFDYMYAEGYPPTSLQWCFRCDPDLGMFDPNVMIPIWKDGFAVDWLIMMVQPMV